MGHSIDDVSYDGNFANVPLSKTTTAQERASSDYDIRHTFSAAVSYDIPSPGSGVLKQVFGSCRNWNGRQGFDCRVGVCCGFHLITAALK